MPVTHFDWANYQTTVRNIFKDIYSYDGLGASAVAFGYWRQTTNRIRGFYFDLYGGGGNLSSFQAAPSLDPNGNSGDWEPNKALVASEVRTHMRTLDPDFYFSTENAEEGLIGAFDIHHVGGIGDSSQASDNIWGSNLWMFGVVYSRFQALYDLALTLNDTAFQNPSQQVYYAVLMSSVFHGTGGHVCISNGIEGQVIIPTDPPTQGNCTLYYLVVSMQSFIAAMDATPVIRTYMRTGYRMRPLPASWEGDYIESGRGMFQFLADEVGAGNQGVFVCSSVWLNPAADPDFPATSSCLGIVISSVSTEATLTYNIYIDSEAYDLVPDRPKALYLRTGASRTEIARFTDVLDQDITITFNGTSAPFYLYEIVQL